MSVYHGQSKLSPDLNIYQNCMVFFSSVKIELKIGLKVSQKVRIFFLILAIIKDKKTPLKMRVLVFTPRARASSNQY